MPNNVTTVCEVFGPDTDLDAFASAHLGHDRNDAKIATFDFQTIAPMPAVLDGTQAGTYAELGFVALNGPLAAFRTNRFINTTSVRSFLDGYGAVPKHIREREELRTWLSDYMPQALVEGRQALRAYEETKHMSWYEWSIEHWGTKWNAYQVEIRERESRRQVFKFETAWSFPEPIFVALAVRYPTLRFDVRAFDEG